MPESDQTPIVAITSGDVAGVGPELVAMLLGNEEVFSLCRPVVIGPKALLKNTAEAIGSAVRYRSLEDLSKARFDGVEIEVIDPLGAVFATPEVGKVSVAAGKAAAVCLETAFTLAAEHRIDGVVGAPLNKESFRKAGYEYLDEIAFLSEFTHSPEPRLFGILRGMLTTCVTLHIPFRDVPAQITRANVLEAITAMQATLVSCSREQPRIAVAALNPHKGENGLLGWEEIEQIAPAIAEAKTKGIAVDGPFPADTVFPVAAADGYDGLVCMYHDQANIGRKLNGFTDSASAFLGLPVPYATTAHGTAFDIVGTGKVDPSSIIAALRFVVAQCPTKASVKPAQNLSAAVSRWAARIGS